MARLAAFNPAVKSMDESVDRAKAAERLGYESVWVTQLPDARDAFLVLAAYGAATERVGLGTGVLPIYTRHPTAMVQMALTLDELTGGRFVLGIGIGHKVVVEGMWGLKIQHPVDAMREYLTIVRAGIRDGSGGIDGEHFSAHWAYSAPRRADLPIMISALHPRMLELAGELADGVVLGWCSPAYVRDGVIPFIKVGREKVGKSVEGSEIVAVVPACLTSDRGGAHKVFRQTVERYSHLPYYRKVMDASGFQQDLDSGQISEAMLDELGGIGDEHQVRDAIRRYRDAGVTLPGINPFGGHQGAAGHVATLEAAATA